MKITIRNLQTRRATVYTAAELAREARRVVRGLGRLESYEVVFIECGNAVLYAYWANPGAHGVASVAI